MSSGVGRSTGLLELARQLQRLSRQVWISWSEILRPAKHNGLGPYQRLLGSAERREATAANRNFQTPAERTFQP